MILLACTIPFLAGALESYLIHKFSGDTTTCRGCQNTDGGGETIPSVAPVFVYFVTVTLEDFTQRQLSAARRDYGQQVAASFASGAPS